VSAHIATVRRTLFETPPENLDDLIEHLGDINIDVDSGEAKVRVSRSASPTPTQVCHPGRSTAKSRDLPGAACGK
jgi:hypothetical protein